MTCPNRYCDGKGWITAGATTTTNAYRVPACKVGPHGSGVAIHIDARTQKALELAATAVYTWARLGSGAFRVPSQGNPGQEYTCSPTMCECQDSRRNPERLCKHSIAASILVALIETQPEPARTGLVATREDEDVVSWDRAEAGIERRPSLAACLRQMRLGRRAGM